MIYLDFNNSVDISSFRLPFKKKKTVPVGLNRTVTTRTDSWQKDFTQRQCIDVGKASGGELPESIAGLDSSSLLTGKMC